MTKLAVKKLTLIFIATVLLFKSGQSATQGDPPASFNTYTSTCSSTHFNTAPGVPGFPELASPDDPPFTGTPPGEQEPPGSPEVVCICWDANIAANKFVQFNAVFACDACNVSMAACDTGCVPVEKVDSDGDGVAWPEDSDEPYPADQLPDSDNDSCPDTYDSTPNGEDPTADDFVFKDGILPHSTTMQQLVEMCIEAGIEGMESLPAVGADLSQVLAQDINNDGMLTVSEAATTLVATLGTLTEHLEDEHAQGNLTDREYFAQLTAIHNAVNAVVRLALTINPELMEGIVGEYLEDLAESIEVEKLELVGIGGFISDVDHSVCGQFMSWISDNPDGFNGLVIRYLDELGAEVDPEAGVGSRFRRRPTAQDSLTGDPVETGSGDFRYSRRDLAVPGRRMDLNLTRYYSSRSIHQGPFGHNWTMPLVETRLLVLNGGEVLAVGWGDGTSSIYNYNETGDIWIGSSGTYGKADIRTYSDDPDGSVPLPRVVVRQPDGTEYHFCTPKWTIGAAEVSVSWLRKVTDAYGNAIVIRRGEGNLVQEIVDTLGNLYTFEYHEGSTLIKSIAYPSGELVSYLYNARGELESVTYPQAQFEDSNGQAFSAQPGETYTYSEHPDGWESNKGKRLNHNLESITEHGAQSPKVLVFYETGPGYSYDKVISHDVDGEVTHYRYFSLGIGTSEGEDEYSPTEADHRTDVLYPDGQLARFIHGNGALLRYELENGFFDQAWQQTSPPYINPIEGVVHAKWMTQYEYDDHGEFSDFKIVEIVQTTDAIHPAGRRVEYGYDDSNPDRFRHNNVLMERMFPHPPEPTQPEQLTEYGYDPVTNNPIEKTDVLGRQWTRKMGHFEKTYEDAADLEKISGWGILPIGSGQPDAVLFGQGDLNGDGVESSSFLPVHEQGPLVTVEDDQGPGMPGPQERPTSTRKYNAHGQPTEFIDPAGIKNLVAYAGGRPIKQIRDRNGLVNVTNFGYSQDGHLELIDDPQAGHLQLTLDVDGKVTKASYMYDVTVSIPISGEGSSQLKNVYREYGYDISGRILSTSSIAKEGNATLPIETLGYDAIGRVTDRTQYVYDESGALLTQGHWTTQYDGSGEKSCETNPVGLQTSFTRDSRGLAIKIESTAPGMTDPGPQYVHYDAFGSPTQKIDPEGRASAYKYDGYGRLVEVTYPSGLIEKNTLDAAGRALSVEAHEGQTLVSSVEYEYDAYNRVLKEDVANLVVDHAGGVTAGSPAAFVTENGYGIREGDHLWTVDDPQGVARLERFEFDSLGRKTGHWYGQSSDVGVYQALNYAGRPASVTRRYDSEGRTGNTSPSESTWTAQYGALGLIVKRVDPAGAEVVYEYNAQRLPKEVRDPNGNVTQLHYNSAGQVIKKVRLGVPGEGDVEEEYTYDVLGRLSAVKDGSQNQTSFTYDPIGRLKEKTYSDGSTTTYAYDATGRLLSKDEPGAGYVQYEYFLDGGLKGVTASGADASVDRDIERDGLGRWLSITELVDGRERTVVRRSVDSLGRALSTEQSIGNDPFRRFDVGYDGGGALSNVVYPTGTVISRSVDSLGRTSQISSSIAGILATYDDHYGLERVRRVDTLNNGYLVREFDPSGRAIEISSWNRFDQPICGYQYTYDGSGNLTDRYRVTDGRHEEFEYDSFDRIEAWRFDVDTSGVAGRTVSWGWDPSGNVAVYDDTSLAGPLSGTANELNQLTSLTPQISTFGYTLRGEESSNDNIDGGRDLKWDAIGRLYEATVEEAQGDVVVSYTHNGLNDIARREDSVRGVLTFSYHGRVLLETISSVLGVQEIVTGYTQSQRLGRQSDTDGWRYYEQDSAGSVISLHNGGVEAESYEYDPFGRARDGATGVELQVGDTENDLLFIGLPCDLLVGISHVGVRPYDYDTGRFLRRDPAGVAGGLNLYAYADSNPLRWKDPSGFGKESVTEGPHSVRGWLGEQPGLTVLSENPFASIEAFANMASSVLADSVAEYGVVGALVMGETEAVIDALREYIEVNEGNLGDLNLHEQLTVLNSLEFASATIEFLSRPEHPAMGSVASEQFQIDIVDALDAASIAADATVIGGSISWVFDIASATIYISRGDYWNGGLSLVAALPFLGSAVNGGRLAYKGVSKGLGYADQAKAVAGSSDRVSLFRAVTPEELSDIENVGRFRNPPGILNKYFTDSAESARAYGDKAEAVFGDGRYTVVETSIPRSAVTPEMDAGRVADIPGGLPTVTVPTEKLDLLSPPVVH